MAKIRHCCSNCVHYWEGAGCTAFNIIFKPFDPGSITDCDHFEPDEE